MCFLIDEYDIKYNPAYNSMHTYFIQENGLLIMIKT